MKIAINTDGQFGAMTGVPFYMTGVQLYVDSLIATLSTLDTPHAPGCVSCDEMNALVSSREAFACVSEYEGFGPPPLEAMVCGAPVLVSRAASLPEVVGDAGIQAAPDDVDAMASALLTLLTDCGENARRRTPSLARARAFGWERTARLTRKSYEAAAA